MRGRLGVACLLPAIFLCGRRCAAAEAVPAASTGSQSAGASVIRFIDFKTEVHRVTAEWVIQAIDLADREGDALVLIQLDTPGGFVGSLEEIVQRMLASKTPIVVWVGPSGVKAASAGFIMMIAADVASMAPGTNAGATAVVGLGGSGSDEDTSHKKAMNDVAARVRSIADHRKRNVKACEEAVYSARSYSDAEALEKGIIDLVARDRDELLRRLDGLEVLRFDGGSSRLRTAGAKLVPFEMTARQHVLSLLANPTIVYFLLMLGLGGLYLELSNPGLIFPGVIGALSLLLFAYACQILPVSAVGIALLLAGIGMFVVEIKVTSYGLLTLGGIFCLVVGSLMLFDGPPEVRLSLPVVLPGSLVLGGACAFAVRLAVRAQRAPVVTGVEGLSGELGTVTVDVAPEGKVFVHGELWDAVSVSGPLPRGARVRVVRVDGIRLIVEPAHPGAAGGGTHD